MKIAVPSYIFEGLNAVRKAGTFNMFDIEAVKIQAVALGYPETAEWIEANSEVYVNGIFQGFRSADEVPIGDIKT